MIPIFFSFPSTFCLYILKVLVLYMTILSTFTDLVITNSKMILLLIYNSKANLIFAQTQKIQIFTEIILSTKH